MTGRFAPGVLVAAAAVAAGGLLFVLPAAIPGRPAQLPAGLQIGPGRSEPMSVGTVLAPSRPRVRLDPRRSATPGPAARPAMSPDPVTVVVPTHPLVVESEPGDGPAEHRHDD